MNCGGGARREPAELGQERPLLTESQEFRDLYEKRRPYYLRASLRHETGGKAVAGDRGRADSSFGAASPRGKPRRKLVTLIAHVRWGMVAVLACAVVTYARDKKDNPKPAGSQTVDSGSFGVFVKGQRVVTESFSVQQDNGISIVKSRLQESGNSAAAVQRSELQMTGSGELVRYEWSDGKRLAGGNPQRRIPAGKDYDCGLLQARGTAVSHAEHLGHSGQQLFHSPRGPGVALSGTSCPAAARLPIASASRWNSVRWCRKTGLQCGYAWNWWEEKR